MKLDQRNVLITGGSGYLGQELVFQALESGYKVSSLDINPPRERIPTVRYLTGSVLDVTFMRESFANIYAVIHAVAAVPLAKDDTAFENVNVGGTRIAVDSAVKNQVSKFIYISTSAVYGVPPSNPVTEATAVQPIESYGAAKLAGENICIEAASGELDVKVIRPRTILGAGRLGIFGTLFEWIVDGASVPYVGKGDNVYQFVHIEDLARATILSLETEGLQILNVGSHGALTMKESLDTLCEIANNGARTFSIPKPLFKFSLDLAGHLKLLPFAPYHAAMFSETLVFDTSKTERTLNWKSNFSSTEALVESFMNFQQNKPSVHENLVSSPHTSLPKPGLLRMLKWLSKRLFSTGR